MGDDSELLNIETVMPGSKNHISTGKHAVNEAFEEQDGIEEIEGVRAILMKAEASGISNRTLREILAASKAELRKDGLLWVSHRHGRRFSKASWYIGVIAKKLIPAYVVAFFEHFERLAAF